MYRVFKLQSHFNFTSDSCCQLRNTTVFVLPIRLNTLSIKSMNQSINQLINQSISFCLETYKEVIFSYPKNSDELRYRLIVPLYTHTRFSWFITIPFHTLACFIWYIAVPFHTRARFSWSIAVSSAFPIGA